MTQRPNDRLGLNTGQFYQISGEQRSLAVLHKRGTTWQQPPIADLPGGPCQRPYRLRSTFFHKEQQPSPGPHSPKTAPSPTPADSAAPVPSAGKTQI